MKIKKIYESDDGIEFSTEEAAQQRDSIVAARNAAHKAYCIYEDLEREEKKLRKACTHEYIDVRNTPTFFDYHITCRMCDKKWDTMAGEKKIDFKNPKVRDLR